MGDEQFITLSKKNIDDTMKLQNFSRLPNRIEPNRIKHGFAESEIFQYFDIFMSSVRFDISGKF